MKATARARRPNYGGLYVNGMSYHLYREEPRPVSLPRSAGP